MSTWTRFVFRFVIQATTTTRPVFFLLTSKQQTRWLKGDKEKAPVHTTARAIVLNQLCRIEQVAYTRDTVATVAR